MLVARLVFSRYVANGISLNLQVAVVGIDSHDPFMFEVVLVTITTSQLIPLLGHAHHADSADSNESMLNSICNTVQKY